MTEKYTKKLNVKNSTFDRKEPAPVEHDPDEK